MSLFSTIVVFAALALLCHSQSCSTTLAPTASIRPSLASGYRAQLIATGLSRPRGIQFDDAGNLLVVEAGTGSISALTFTDGGGTCLTVSGNTTVVAGQQLNHGIALSSNGSVLYASSSVMVSAWNYNSSSRTASNNRTLIAGMDTSGHTTRTLLLSQTVPGLLVVSRGSTSNLDLEAAQLSSGHSQVKAFDVSNMTESTYDYPTQGLRLGWGLRNSVGLAEHPLTGGIWSVENSVDQMMRHGEDVHQNNPGEEMNFLGYLNGTEYPEQGQNFGYPWCFSAWNVSTIPSNSNLTVGRQFAIDPIDGQSRNDSYCAAQVPPRLTFQAHMAPLDVKFNNSGSQAWVSFHGSWDRTDPVGYKLSVIEFENGAPVAASTDMSAARDIFTNADNTACPNDCFRPVGIAFDGNGRLFLSSDTTGEIYVIVRDESSTSTSSPTSATATGSRPSSTNGLPPSITPKNIRGIVLACVLLIFLL